MKKNIYFFCVFLLLSSVVVLLTAQAQAPSRTKQFSQTMPFKNASQSEIVSATEFVQQETPKFRELLTNYQQKLASTREFSFATNGNDTLIQVIPSLGSSILADSSIFHGRTQSSLSKNTSGEKSSTPKAMNMRVSQPIESGSGVGNIIINSTLSNGSVNYSIPLDVYSTGKIAPSVSLSYNSMGAQGVAGYGWTIGGILTIRPGNSNYYYDGLYAGTTKLDKSSAFYLDGIRLIKLSENSQEIIYEAEQGKVKVVSHFPSKKYYFTVYYPDGNIAQLGSINDIQAQLDYPITKMEDRLGNTIWYSYATSGNCHYITGISYSSSQSVGLGSISFNYRNITQTNPVYIAGREIYQDRLLTGISTKYPSGEVYRDYRLSYSTDSYNRHFLSQFSCSSGNVSLNPLRFSYGEEYAGEGWLYKEVNNLLWEYYEGDVVIKKIKLNNNSPRNGLIIYPNFETYGITGQSKQGYYTYGSTYSPDVDLLVYDNLRPGGLSTPHKIKAGTGFQLLTAVDYNGDGSDELIKINYVEENKKGKITITTYDKNFVPNSRDIYLEGYVQEGDWRSPVYRYWNFGDFDGDGKLELFTVNNRFGPRNAASSYSKIDIVDLNTKQIISSTFLGYDIDCFSGEQLFFADLNGDSKSEIALISVFGTALYEHEVSPDYLYRMYTQEQTLTSQSLQNRYFFIEDINGDGKMDFLLSPSFGSSSWSIFSSTGLNFIRTTYSPFTRSGNETYIFEDVNGDGRPDLIRKSGSSMWAYLNQEGKLGLIPESGSQSVESSGKLIGASITGLSYSNRSSQVLVVKDSYVTPISYSRNDAIARMLSQMTNSMGVTSSYSYANITTGDFYTVNPSVLSFPYNKVFAPINVVRSTSTYSGWDMIDSQNFYYEDAVIHKQLGFRGFSKVTSDVYPSGDVITRKYNPMNFGVLTSIENSTMSESYTYSTSIAFNKIVKIHLDEKVSTNKLTDKTITSSYTYDTYDNLTSEITFDKEETNVQLAINSFSNYTSLSDYYLGELNSQIIGRENLTNDVLFVTETSTTYNTKHLPVSRKQYVEGKQINEEQYIYDAQYNLKESKTKAYESSDWLMKQMEYDALGRVSKETDALGLSVQYIYNNKGELASSKNYKGQETIFTYDNFGQLANISYPDGSEKRTEVDWFEQIASTEFPGVSQPEDIVLSNPTEEGEIRACQSVILRPGFSFRATSGKSLVLKTDKNVCASPPQSSSLAYVVTEEATGSPTVKTYYDAMGREVRKSQERFDGVYMNIDTQYDRKGLINKKSDPFKNGSEPQWNTYSYDTYHRLTSITYASGKVDSYSYDKNTVSSVIDGVPVTKEYNILGQTVKVIDPSGSILYSYRSDGQPASITAPGGIVISFEYDEYGRQTKIIDASAGTQVYAYDTAGNLSRTTNANGELTVLAYDRYHRLTQKAAPELTTTYHYDEYGRLTSESSNNATSRHLTYDAFDRIVHEKETVMDGEHLEKAFQYAGNVLSATTYATGQGTIATERYSYAHGYHVETQLEGKGSVWKLDAEDARGHITGITTGMLTRTYQYDNLGFPVSRTANSGYGTILSHNYEFDHSSGNLTFRSDNRRGKTETFQYDELNRLTGVNGVQMYAYAPTGNITSSLEVGAFEYNHPGKPYAITEVRGTSTNSIPLREQTVNYTSFSRPSDITENGMVARFSYNSSGNRVRMSMESGSGTLFTRYYIGNQYEKEISAGNTTEQLYLGGDAYSAPLVYRNEGNGWNIYYICRDYLGNIVQVTNSSGLSVQELSFDAWGRLRNPDTHDIYAVGQEPDLFLNRGYTGHEHLIAFGLINMNARLYDPVLGRFLSPDPYVQAPEYSQNFNRYTYGLNNPLRYVDLDGENPLLLFIVGGALIGAYTGASIKGGSWNPAKWQGNWWQGAIYGGLIGAAAGAGIGSVWAVGGSISFGVNAYNFNTIELISFSSASASTGSGVTMTVGAGLGLGSTLSYSFGRKEERVTKEEPLSSAEMQQVVYRFNKMMTESAGNFYIGTGLAATSEVFYSKDLGTWMGKNGKMYDQSWGGNQYTGGKYKFANSMAKPFRYGSNALGLYNMYNSVSDGFEGKISAKEATGDVLFGSAAIYSGFWGGVANFGYTLGKEYDPMTTYLRLQKQREEENRNRSMVIEYMRKKGYFE